VKPKTVLIIFIMFVGFTGLGGILSAIENEDPAYVVGYCIPFGLLLWGLIFVRNRLVKTELKLKEFIDKEKHIQEELDLQRRVQAEIDRQREKDGNR